MDAAESAKKKKRIRAGHRASTTRTLKQVEEALIEEYRDSAKLTRLRMTLNEKLATLRTLDAEIIELTEEETQLEQEIEQADTFKESIYDALVRIEELTLTPNVETRPVSEPGRHKETARVKLPKINLRSFSSDITKWTTFWDSFEAAIHANPNLSDIDKFNYLHSLLEKTARDAISGLTLTSANYHEAIAILKQRFGRKQQIISKHMDVLLNAEPVTSPHATKALRQLYDLAESHIRSLNSLGVTSNAYGSLLSPVLLSKLPSEIRLIISRQTSEEEWNLDDLLKTMRQEIEAREQANAGATTSTRLAEKPTESTPHTAAALVSKVTSSAPTCCFCQQGHASSTCRVVTAVNQRKNILKRAGRCFVCLRRGHIGRTCRSMTRCCYCNLQHHSSICESDKRDNQPTDHPQQPNPPAHTQRPTEDRRQLNSTTGNTSNNRSTSLFTGSNETILLQTAQADVYNPTQPHRTERLRMILDGGSQHSYITYRVGRELGLTPQGERRVVVSTFGSENATALNCNIVKLGLRTRRGPDLELDFFTVERICDPISPQPIALCVETHPHLSSLTLADTADESMEVDLLLGSDHYWKVATGEIIRGEGGPVAIATRLGWVLSGPAALTGQERSTNTLIVTHALQIGAAPVKQLDDILRTFWDLEALGIHEEEESPLNGFAECITFVNGRYEVPLPWRESHGILLSNRALALNRLHGLLRRLEQHPEIRAEYDAIIQDQLNKGIVEVVPEDTDVPRGRVHYLPHHAVIRQDKETTKVRIVYDASAQSNGTSLNDCLHTGPKSNQKILDILLRFRCYRVALTADIEKAFLMISINKEDRDVLRFFWIDDATLEQPRVITMRFTRVVFGVSSSPFLLNATIKHHVERFASDDPQLVSLFLQSIYVDDIVFGADSEEDAYELYSRSKHMLKEGSFNLRKFATNVLSLQQKIDQEEELTATEHVAKDQHTGQLDESYAQATLGARQPAKTGIQKVLGIHWNLESDDLLFDFNDIVNAVDDESLPTKRDAVSLVGRFYDPIAVMVPVVISFKILLQEICESRVGWDETLEGPLLQIRATYLCGFCDASNKAYAAVIYLIIETDGGNLSRFVVSKTRVSPVRQQTIPRLELLSALILARLMQATQEALSGTLSLKEPILYTDSRVALYWICGMHKEWKQFVQNRVNEIRKLTPLSRWRHCPGRVNPADLPSRGMSPMELSSSPLWLCGPHWMPATTTESPEELQPQDMPAECAVEMKVIIRRQLHTLIASNQPTGLGEMIKCENFSTLTRLLRVTSRVVQFIQILKAKLGPRVEGTDNDYPQPDIVDAQKRWVAASQVKLLEHPSFSTWKKQFRLFLDPDGIWRCGGRLVNSELPYSTKHPILLSKDHPLTTLIVRQAHEKLQHDGVKETLTEVRSKYWIVKGRSMVKSIIHRCVVCRRFEGLPYSAPPAPPLPSFRVREAPPFEYTAVDFAGPMYCRTADVTKTKKIWICLYTCCVTRAVHLDIVPDMSAATFIRSVRRFCARRGLPRMFISDNAKTFKAASRMIADVSGQKEVQLHLERHCMEWRYNLEKAPWWGGLFERMVRMTKRCLRKMIGQAKLDYDELLTAVTEVEAIINARPLTYLSEDDKDEPLTPSHLMVGRRLLTLPEQYTGSQPLDDDDFEVAPSQLRKRSNHLKNVLNHYWKRWKHEYLTELREAHRHAAVNQVDKSVVATGDVVVVHDEALPRGLWRLARVQELITGQDGQVRGAVLRVISKTGEPTILRRQLQLLYPLEVRDPGNADTNGIIDTTQTLPSESEETTPQCTTGRPQRQSAIRAREKLKNYWKE